MRSNTGSPGFVGKTNGLCQNPSFLHQEDRGLWVRDCRGSCLKLFMRMLNERLVLECFGIEFRTGLD